MNPRPTKIEVEPLERRVLLAESFETGSTEAIGDDFAPSEPAQPVQYQPYTITFHGPFAAELDLAPNPFLDYRLNVSFLHESGLRYDNVPGYFNGDGAGGAGSQWKVLFTPPLEGTWKYVASFRAGQQLAVSLDPLEGMPAAFDGFRGVLDVANADPNAPGFLSKGLLRHDGFYPRFDNGEHFVKAGMNSPENFLGYSGFDNTPEAKHHYGPHVVDWREGDPDWNNGAGKGIVGFVNYIADQGLNSIFFMPMNIGGDAQDTWPFAGTINPDGHTSNDNVHYDLSKLDQWEIVLSHAQRKGIQLHVVLNEAEEFNKRELDDATLGVERKLFYRELVARFGHHNALQWNISEEYDHEKYPLPPELMAEWAGYIQAVDPYDHPIAIHNFHSTDSAFTPFLGDPRFTAASFQYSLGIAGRGDEVEEWRDKSELAGQSIVISMDELRATTTSNLAAQRRDILWPTLLSGGHVEFYLGGAPELSYNDFRPYESLWARCGIALDFMSLIPFWEMTPNDSLLSGEYSSSNTGSGQVFAKPGEAYAIYLPNASATGTLDLRADFGVYQMAWFNPRTGDIHSGPVVEGGTTFALGPPPAESSQDWAVLLRSANSFEPPAAPTNFGITQITDHSVTLVWTDVSDDESGFKIQISTDGQTFDDIATAPRNATSIVVDGLQPLTTYFFRVRSDNIAGEGEAQTTLMTTTQERIWPFYISRLVLVNADTDQDIADMHDGFVIDFAIIGTDNLNIRAEAGGVEAGEVESIRFVLDGSTYAIENLAPYALAGDNQGDYRSWTPSLGEHSLAATPYDNDNASGAAGGAMALSFSVTDSLTQPATFVMVLPDKPMRRDPALPRPVDLILGDDKEAR